MEIIWTNFATDNLKSIFNYFSLKANRKVAHKIRLDIIESTHPLKTHPKIGQIEPNLKKLGENHRYIVNGNYKIIYLIKNNTIVITDVFDTRQDPDKMGDEERERF